MSAEPRKKRATEDERGEGEGDGEEGGGEETPPRERAAKRQRTQQELGGVAQSYVPPAVEAGFFTGVPIYTADLDPPQAVASAPVAAAAAAAADAAAAAAAATAAATVVAAPPPPPEEQPRARRRSRKGVKPQEPARTEEQRAMRIKAWQHQQQVAEQRRAKKAAEVAAGVRPEARGKTWKEKPYPCPVCGHVVHEKYLLVRHKMWHTNVSPFKCPRCCDIFLEKSNMMRHIRNSHKRDESFEAIVAKAKTQRVDAASIEKMERRLEMLMAERRSAIEAGEDPPLVLGAVQRKRFVPPPAPEAVPTAAAGRIVVALPVAAAAAAPAAAAAAAVPAVEHTSSTPPRKLRGAARARK